MPNIQYGLSGEHRAKFGKPEETRPGSAILATIGVLQRDDVSSELQRLLCRTVQFAKVLRRYAD
jgi:hypothetical protein